MPSQIAVLPAAARDDHSYLFSTLERALPVRFVSEHDDAQARLAVGVEPPPSSLPTLVVPRVSECTGGAPATVSLSNDPTIPAPLRGRRLQDNGPRARWPEQTSVGGDELASGDGLVWAARGERRQVSAYPLPALGSTETLRDHLRPGRFMGLLPLLALAGVPERALRACVILDDPNLHWPSYGRIDFRRLVDHAVEGGYHVAFATVPRDSWLVNRRAATLVREHPQQLSLLVHGNDHTAHELGRLADPLEAERTMAQALRRVAALERRAGVEIDRVMVPPHERCSAQALEAMLRVGFEAACIGRPHPWRDSEPPASPLLGWRAAEFVAGGLPVLPRHSLRRGREELLFRALLGQPVILYGHHGDRDELDDAAAFVNGLGDVRWLGVGAIARTNVVSRREGEELTVELSSRRVSVHVPEGVREIRCLTCDGERANAWRGLRGAGQMVAMRPVAGGFESDPLAVDERCRLELELVPQRLLDPAGVERPRWRAWPLVRRLLSEGRDRAAGALAADRRQVVMLLQNNAYPQDTRVRNEAETLAEHGYDVTVIAPRGPDQAASGRVGPVRVRRFRGPVSDGSPAGYLREYAVAHAKLGMLAVRELLRGAGVLHVHGPPDSVALIGAAGRLFGRRAVFDLHDSAPELFEAKFGSGAARRVLAMIQRAAIRTASLVIVTNESQHGLVRSLADTSVAVVRNGPRATEFAGPLDDPRDGSLAEPRLVYVGALDVQDGVLELAELLARPELSDARLTVVGDGPLAGELSARCRALGLNGRVTLTGPVPHARVPDLIAAADIGIDPAPGTELNHGSTMIKIAEYLAVGRPVVAYRLRETERTAGDAGVLAPCGDSSRFAGLIRELAEDGERRLSLGRRARARADELMWERSASALTTAYAQLP